MSVAFTPWQPAGFVACPPAAAFRLNASCPARAGISGGLRCETNKTRLVFTRSRPGGEWLQLSRRQQQRLGCAGQSADRARHRHALLGGADHDYAGLALTNLAGYRIYYGIKRSDLSGTVQLNSVGLQTYVIDNLGQGTWYFAIRAVTSMGVESPLSNVVSKTIS